MRTVQNTSELGRILSLPRRTWGPDDAFVESATRCFARPGGTMSLRLIQAVALLEIDRYHGGILPVRVGGGKTLISFLAFVVLGSKRPLLLLPAKLIEKTKREMRILSQHWKIPNHIRFVSYEIMGREAGAKILDQYRPDVIGGDECHKLKNPRAGVTRRVNRYMKEHRPKSFWLSGTITNKSIRDYWHILFWALGPFRMPLPNNFPEAEEWANVLDSKEGSEPSPGALVMLSDSALFPDLASVRRGYRDRLVQTPGVIVSQDSRLGSTLTISALHVPQPPVIQSALELLYADWATPDGQAFDEAPGVWRHARELALGFYYLWDPRPPEAWIDARRAWSKVCRHILGNNHSRLDTALDVVNAIDRGLYPGAKEALEAWRDIKPTFEPNTRPEWLSNHVIDAVASWASTSPSIVWVEHRAFAERLAERTGMPYYAAKGLCHGDPIEDADPKEGSIIASVKANSEGRNLQAWSRNLIVSPPKNGKEWEQLMARTHRDGQDAEEVIVDFLVGCEENLRSYRESYANAQYVYETTGAEQKLLYADTLVPETWEEINS